MLKGMDMLVAGKKLEDIRNDFVEKNPELYNNLQATKDGDDSSFIMTTFIRLAVSKFSRLIEEAPDCRFTEEQLKTISSEMLQILQQEQFPDYFNSKKGDNVLRENCNNLANRFSDYLIELQATYLKDSVENPQVLQNDSSDEGISDFSSDEDDLISNVSETESNTLEESIEKNQPNLMQKEFETLLEQIKAINPDSMGLEIKQNECLTQLQQQIRLNADAFSSYLNQLGKLFTSDHNKSDVMTKYVNEAYKTGNILLKNIHVALSNSNKNPQEMERASKLLVQFNAVAETSCQFMCYASYLKSDVPSKQEKGKKYIEQRIEEHKKILMADKSSSMGTRVGSAIRKFLTVAEKTLTGILIGAALGAIGGTVVPGIGTMTGGIVGGVVGGIAGLVKGIKDVRQEEKKMQERKAEKIRSYDSYFNTVLTFSEAKATADKKPEPALLPQQ